jgi:hypothetical protein
MFEETLKEGAENLFELLRRGQIGLSDLFNHLRDRPNNAHVHEAEQVVLVLEIVVEAALGRFRRRRYPVHRQPVNAVLLKHREGGLENRVLDEIMMTAQSRVNTTQSVFFCFSEVSGRIRQVKCEGLGASHDHYGEFTNPPTWFKTTSRVGCHLGRIGAGTVV